MRASGSALSADLLAAFLLPSSRRSRSSRRRLDATREVGVVHERRLKSERHPERTPETPRTSPDSGGSVHSPTRSLHGSERAATSRARGGTTLEDNHVRVLWNGVEVASVIAESTNPDWRVLQVQLRGRKGTSRLELEDVGVSNSFGTYVDTVSLTLQCRDSVSGRMRRDGRL